MQKRLRMIWNTLRAIWRSAPPAGRVLFVIAAAALLALPLFSTDRLLWLALCGFLALLGAVAGYILYQLLFKDHP